MSFDPGPLAAVHGESAGDRWTLVFVKDLRHPPERDPIAVIRGRAAYGYGFDELQDGYSRELGVPIR